MMIFEIALEMAGESNQNKKTQGKSKGFPCRI